MINVAMVTLCLQADPWGEGQWDETTQIGDPEYE